MDDTCQLLDKLRTAIKAGDKEKAKEYCYYGSLQEVLEFDGIEAGRFLLENTGLGELDKQDLLDDLFRCGMSAVGSITDGMKLLTEYVLANSLNITNGEMIYNIMQYPDSFYVLESAIELGIEIDSYDFLTESGRRGYRKHFDLLIDKLQFDKEDYDECLQAAVTSADPQDIADPDPNLTYMIERLLKELNCDVNYDDCGGEFEYSFQNCFYAVPHLAKYFYTDDFDASMLEDIDFWKVVESDMEDSTLYEPAFRDLKASGIEFDDSEIVEIFKNAGHDKIVKILRSDTTDA